jgi:hypothetical protein
MASRANQAKFAGLALLALAGTVGAFVFGILAGEGGKYHLLIILLGVLCASTPVLATAIGRRVTNRLLRTEVDARERAVEERERALASQQAAERQTTEVPINARPGSSSRSGPGCRRRCTESFSSSDLAGLKDVDGFGQLPGLPGAAAEFAQDAPGLELGVGAFAGAA